MNAWGANSSHGGQTETPWETLRNEKKKERNKKTREAMVMTFSGWDREGSSTLLTAVPQVRGETKERVGWLDLKMPHLHMVYKLASCQSPVHSSL